MIYEPVAAGSPIRQGDIFVRVPRIDLSLSELPIIEPGESPRLASWTELLQEGGQEQFIAALTVKPVNGIVLTQDCDCRRAEYVSLAEIVSFDSICGDKQPSTPKKWASLIVKQSRDRLRYFYLPADTRYMPNRMAVDLGIVLRLPRIDLEALVGQRPCRLIPVAYEHYRETIAQFFRRYPYDEWYPLTKDEFEAYRSSDEGAVEPFDWQK